MTPSSSRDDADTAAPQWPALASGALIDRLEAHRDRLVELIHRAQHTQIADLPPDHVVAGAEQVHTTSTGWILDTVIRRIRNRENYTPDDIERLEQIGLTAAAARWTLDQLLWSERVMRLEFLHIAYTTAVLSESAEFDALDSWLARNAAVARRAIHHGYVRRLEQLSSSTVDPHAVAEALLAGQEPGADVPGPFGVVVALRDEGVPVGEAERVVDFWRHVDGLWWVRRPHGWVLVTSLPDPDERHATAAFVDSVRPALVGGPLTGTFVGVAVAPTHRDVPAAARQAERAARLAAANPSCRPLRPHLLAHLVVDDAVAKDADARRSLEALVAPLTGRPDLLDTLTTMYALDLERSGTARTLKIHRGTLDHRLRRVHALTGIDPTTPHGIQLLLTAVSVLGLAAGTAGADPTGPEEDRGPGVRGRGPG